MATVHCMILVPSMADHARERENGGGGGGGGGGTQASASALTFQLETWTKPIPAT